MRNHCRDADAGYSGLYLIDRDGSNPRTLIDRRVDANFEGDARWSPDGTRIAYSRWEPGGIWDPLMGESRTAPWAATSYPAWQRIAP